VRAASGFLLHPFIAPRRSVAIPPTATDDRELRSVEALLDRAQSRDARALGVERAPENRVFCVCAGFARIATAVFGRTASRPAAASGSPPTSIPGFLEDHWACEYGDGAAWRLLDAQLDEATVRDGGIGFSPTDVPRDQFVDAGTAWRRLRTGEIDSASWGCRFLDSWVRGSRSAT
jgi:hypothetical protein